MKELTLQLLYTIAHHLQLYDFLLYAYLVIYEKHSEVLLKFVLYCRKGHPEHEKYLQHLNMFPIL